MNLLQQVQQFIHDHHLFERGDRVIAAVSGGLDSIVMLDILIALHESMKIDLVVAHFNHQLRGAESEEDEQFVRKFSASHGLECYVEGANTESWAESQKLSLQEAARELRYAFFDKLRSSAGFYKIATAHNADDNAETILLNICRGAGVRGLSGIPVWRKDISVVRPLLGVTRDQIESYSREKKLPYRLDSSNLESDYTRNYLRLEIVPQLIQNLNPNLVGTLRRTGQLFYELDQFLGIEAQRILTTVCSKREKDQIVLDIRELHNQPMFMQEYLLLIVARDYTGREIDSSAVKAIVKVSNSETGTTCSIAGDRVVYRDRNQLVFRNTALSNPFCYRIEAGDSYTFEQFGFGSELVSERGPVAEGLIEYIDQDLLGKELLVRNWLEGDWFYPLGLGGKKKLSDFFIDAKVPMYEKHSIPVLVSDGDIVWVCGKRLDDRFKLTSRTKNILKLIYTPQSGKN